jgi:polypeptide N-acetylgalactosaminyltransferase
LKQKLEDYCEERFGEIVRVIRTPKRLGLIAGRNFGVKNATADVVILLDGHCEATTGEKSV